MNKIIKFITMIGLCNCIFADPIVFYDMPSVITAQPFESIYNNESSNFYDVYLMEQNTGAYQATINSITVSDYSNNIESAIAIPEFTTPFANYNTGLFLQVYSKTPLDNNSFNINVNYTENYITYNLNKTFTLSDVPATDNYINNGGNNIIFATPINSIAYIEYFVSTTMNCYGIYPDISPSTHLINPISPYGLQSSPYTSFLANNINVESDINEYVLYYNFGLIDAPSNSPYCATSGFNTYLFIN